MSDNSTSYIKNSDDIKFCGIKKRFLFLFEGLDVTVWRAEKIQREREELEKRIKLEKARIRREKRIRKVRILAEKLENQIREYLLKASPPRNDFERMLLEKMKKELGTITSVKELSLFLKISRTCIYDAIQNGEILFIQYRKRKLVITEGILPFLRN